MSVYFSNVHYCTVQGTVPGFIFLHGALAHLPSLVTVLCLFPCFLGKALNPILPLFSIVRVKLLMNSARPHNQKDADKAGGMGAADNGPKLRSADTMVM